MKTFNRLSIPALAILFILITVGNSNAEGPSSGPHGSQTPDDVLAATCKAMGGTPILVFAPEGGGTGTQAEMMCEMSDGTIVPIDGGTLSIPPSNLHGIAGTRPSYAGLTPNPTNNNTSNKPKSAFKATFMKFKKPSLKVNTYKAPGRWKAPTRRRTPQKMAPRYNSASKTQKNRFGSRLQYRR